MTTPNHLRTCLPPFRSLIVSALLAGTVPSADAQDSPSAVSSPPPAAQTVTGRIGKATASARIEPDRASWLNAIQQYPYADGALYQVYAAPGRVTDIALQPGEELVGAGPVAAGDTVRWIIGDTSSGAATTKQVHILVKPTRADLMTNLVINTDPRTYHLELRATPATYMAAISWTYPQDMLIALKASRAEAERVAPVATAIDPPTLISGIGSKATRPHGARRALSTMAAGPMSSSPRGSQLRKCHRSS